MTFSFLIFPLSLLLAAAALIAMGATDWHRRLIPNSLILLFAGLFIPFYLTAPPTIAADIVLWQHGLAALVVFLFTFFCFTRGWLGGGDAKLVPAVALWLGPQATLPFLLLMVFGGGFVAITVLVIAGRRRAEWKRIKLPYGIAITFAALVMLWIEYGQPLSAAVEGITV